MSDLALELDLEPLRSLGKDLETFGEELNRSVQLLAGQVHLHIIEEASQRLHSRREIYIKALAKPTEVSPGVWMITLDKSGVWIEDGMEQHSMVKDLLGDSPETAKDGSRYRVIPFKHDKGPASSTPAEQELVTAIKSELKQMRVPWKGIERNTDGSPRSGTLHRFNIEGPPRPPGTEAAQGSSNQHGYGHGAVGKPMMGPTGIPFLHGVRVMQNPLFDAGGKPKLDRKGHQMASRSVMTFRVVSSKHESEGRWQYPGIEGTHFMDDAVVWAERTWDSKILPGLMVKIGAT